MGMLNLVRDKCEGTYGGGGEGKTLWPRLVPKVAEGKKLHTRVELETKKVTIEQISNSRVSP